MPEPPPLRLRRSTPVPPFIHSARRKSDMYLPDTPSSQQVNVSDYISSHCKKSKIISLNGESHIVTHVGCEHCLHKTQLSGEYVIFLMIVYRRFILFTVAMQ